MSLAESERPEVNISSLDCVTGRATDSGGMWDRAFLRETYTVSAETERRETTLTLIRGTQLGTLGALVLPSMSHTLRNTAEGQPRQGAHLTHMSASYFFP